MTRYFKLTADIDTYITSTINLVDANEVRGLMGYDADYALDDAHWESAAKRKAFLLNKRMGKVDSEDTVAVFTDMDNADLLVNDIMWHSASVEED